MIKKIRRLLSSTANKDFMIKKPISVYHISVFIAILLLLFFLLDGDLCLFKNLFGLPCPSCGMTRAYISLVRLDIKTAFYYHPLFILPLIIAIILLFKNSRFIAKIYKNEWFWIIVLLLTVSVWIIRMIMLFPDNSPMDFNENSLLFRILMHQ